MEVIVLAGGLGTRLRSVINTLPKPMAPICNKPFLEYIFQYLKKNDVHRVILSIGYQWKSIKKYFGNIHNGIELVYSIEDEPLGTGGAIKKSMNEVINDRVYIINGDTFFNVNLNCLHLQNNYKLVLALKKMYDFNRYGCVKTDNSGVVIGFTKKMYHKKGNINGGVYLTSKFLFDNYNLEENFSFEEFIQKNFKKLNIKTVTFDSYFVDIGIPDDYEKAQRELKEHI